MSRAIFFKYIVFLFASLLVVKPVWSQDITLLGGDLSNSIPGHNGIQVTAPNVTDPDRIAKQLSGFSIFHRKVTKPEGLGPHFINSSCGGCHVQNGKGHVRIRRSRARENEMVIKVSLVGLDQDGAPLDVPGVGEQLLDRSLRKSNRFNVRLRWRKVKGSYPDGEKYTLRSPRLIFRIKGYKRKQIVSSLRMTPQLIGLGLIEAIPESAILNLSDPEDSNGDGISGEPNYVPNKRTGGLSIGRFGFRAGNPTVEQQSAGASFFDMGVSNVLFPQAGVESELSDDQLDKLVIYQMLAGVPKARNQDDPLVLRGKELFQTVGCNDCHVMTFTTELASHPELDNQTIHPFTDVLLHDMGPGLADRRPERAASGSEWRTTPLWGLGFVSTISRVRQRYLHDGRARSIEEAILWHAGEAEASQLKFKDLPKTDREALIAFLNSL